MRTSKGNSKFCLLSFVIALFFYPISVFSNNICIDPGYGWDTTHPLNGWDNCGPEFDINGKPYRTLRQPKNLTSDPTALSNTIEIPKAEWPNWLLLKKNGAPLGLLEYQNTWKISNYLKTILENRHHTVHLTKSKHDNPPYRDRAQVALDNDCDFMISIHTNAIEIPTPPPGADTYAVSLFYAKSVF